MSVIHGLGRPGLLAVYANVKTKDKRQTRRGRMRIWCNDVDDRGRKGREELLVIITRRAGMGIG